MGTLTWNYAFLSSLHCQPDVDGLELSLKTKSFTGLVSKGGLSKTKGPLNATICYLLLGIALVICFVFTDWVPESCYGITVYMRVEKGNILGFIKALMSLSCHRSFWVATA